MARVARRGCVGVAGSPARARSSRDATPKTRPWGVVTIAQRKARLGYLVIFSADTCGRKGLRAGLEIDTGRSEADQARWKVLGQPACGRACDQRERRRRTLMLAYVGYAIGGVARGASSRTQRSRRVGCLVSTGRSCASQSTLRAQVMTSVNRAFEPARGSWVGRRASPSSTRPPAACDRARQRDARQARATAG